MDLPLITMEKPEAKEAARLYRTLIDDPKRRHTKIDEMAYRAYNALARNVDAIGLLSLVDAFKRAGEDEHGYPKIAVARADLVTVHLVRRNDGSLQFTPPHRRWSNGNEQPGLMSADGLTVRIPAGTLSMRTSWPKDKRAVVPLIPPQHRPTGNLDRFHLLWEVEQWIDVPQPPRDPALLRHLGGDLWAVLATWDLTAVERLALAIG